MNFTLKEFDKLAFQMILIIKTNIRFLSEISFTYLFSILS
jgi:hypothetical protein